MTEKRITSNVSSLNHISRQSGSSLLFSCSLLLSLIPRKIFAINHLSKNVENMETDTRQRMGSDFNAKTAEL